MLHCGRCGFDLTSNARYCARCGERVGAAIPESPQGLPAHRQYLTYEPNATYQPVRTETAEVPAPPGFYHWPPKPSMRQPVATPAYLPVMPAMSDLSYPAPMPYQMTAPYWQPQFIEARYPPHLLVTATPERRLAGYALDWLILVCTLGIGWLVWFCMAAPNGQTPAKQLLNMYIIRDDGTRAGGGYTWVRQFLVKGVFVLANVLTLGIVGLIAAMWCLRDNDRRCLWDKLGGSYVAYSPQKFKPATAREIMQSREASPFMLDPTRY